MRFQRTLAGVALFTAVAVDVAAAQELSADGLAYGLTPEALSAGPLPKGWIPLEIDPLGGASELWGSHLTCSVELESEDATWKSAPWPGGLVPFEFNANVTALNQTRALAAFAVLQGLETPLVFVPRSGEGDYLHIRNDSVNMSPIGHGGMRTISIFNWGTQAVIVHELLHALSFYHEQSRPDRDSYVQVVTSNIQSGLEHNFQIEGSSLTNGPYDFGSVMHYAQCDFSTCMLCTPGCETLLTQPAYTAFQTTMGQRIGLSPLDIHGVHAVYPQAWWRFVAANSSAGSGTGSDPWQQLSSAMNSAPSGTRLFVMPGTFSFIGTRTSAMTIEAPIGGVVAQ